MLKAERQAKILELVVRNEIGTQEDLLQKLNAAGVNVTQATLSRDIREMQLLKVTGATGKSRYVARTTTTENLDKKYIHILREGFLSMDNAMNMLVIKTVPGMAMAVAAALDHLDLSEIVGSIAGDDTIMCAIRSMEDTSNLMEKIRKILKK